VNRAIDGAGMIGGLVISEHVKGIDERDLLLAFTELTTREQIDLLVKTLSSISQTVSVG
jgi:hypothetical protein